VVQEELAVSMEVLADHMVLAELPIMQAVQVLYVSSGA
jgi:hypothetical protein